MKCSECGKEIPPYRLKWKRKILTCSKICANKRSAIRSYERK